MYVLVYIKTCIWRENYEIIFIKILMMHSWIGYNRNANSLQINLYIQYNPSKNHSRFVCLYVHVHTCIFMLCVN